MTEKIKKFLDAVTIVCLNKNSKDTCRCGCE